MWTEIIITTPLISPSILIQLLQAFLCMHQFPKGRLIVISSLCNIFEVCFARFLFSGIFNKRKLVLAIGLWMQSTIAECWNL